MRRPGPSNSFFCGRRVLDVITGIEAATARAVKGSLPIKRCRSPGAKVELTSFVHAGTRMLAGPDAYF